MENSRSPKDSGGQLWALIHQDLEREMTIPIEQVSWIQVQDYIGRLNVVTGKRYRLPTEAEWEYACRNGDKSHTYCDGVDANNLAWYKTTEFRTFRVGTHSPNELGLFDLGGNVAELTCSNYSRDYDGSEQICASLNSGRLRVFRGGSWYYLPRRVRTIYRYWIEPDSRYVNIGFRLAEDIK